MKRLSISILSLLLLGAFVFAQDEVTIEDLDARVTALEGSAIYLMGSSTVMWGLSGQLMDNSSDWIGEIPSNDLFAETDDDPLWPFVWTLSAEAVDEDGNTLVSAEAEVDMEEEIFDFPEDGEEGNIAYVIIEFPHLVPGMVGLALEDSDTLEIDVHEVSSDTESPRATFTLTPIDGLEAKVGLAYDSLQTMNWFFDDVDAVAFLGAFAGVDPSSLTLDTIVDALVDNAADSESWDAGSYADIAISLQVEYEMAMGDDSITATAGLIYDTAYFNHVFIDSIDQGDLDPFDAYVEETRGPKVAKNLDLIDDDFDDISDDIQDGVVWGYATVPIGVSVAVDMMGIEATVDFMTRLVNGWDVANPDEGKDFDYTSPGDEMDVDYEFGGPRVYAMPMFVSVDAAYEMDMGGMTIAPTANFAFSSDFFKFAANDDGDELEYVGDVNAAEFLGRQMSAGGGLEVTGIADMIDLSIEGSVGFGFGAGDWDWPFDAFYNAVNWPDDITKRNKELNDAHKDAEDALKDLDVDEYMSNGLLFVDDFDAFKVEIGVEATPLDALSIENTFSYTHDGMGVEGTQDEEDTGLMAYAADSGLWLDLIENETVIEYDIMVSDAVGCTLYGEFTYSMWNYAGEEGTYPNKWDKDTETYWIWDSEQSSKSEFEYEIGVKVDVDIWSQGD